MPRQTIFSLRLNLMSEYYVSSNVFLSTDMPDTFSPKPIEKADHIFIVFVENRLFIHILYQGYGCSSQLLSASSHI